MSETPQVPSTASVAILIGLIRSLSGVVDDIAGDVPTPEGLQNLAGLDVSCLPVVEGNPRLGPCIGLTGKFMCIGLNYSDHAAESEIEWPKSMWIRHTHITDLPRRGKSIKAIATRAGHKDPTITLTTYAHMMPGDDEDLAEVADGVLLQATV